MHDSHETVHSCCTKNQGTRNLVIHHSKLHAMHVLTVTVITANTLSRLAVAAVLLAC